MHDGLSVLKYQLGVEYNGIYMCSRLSKNWTL
jgi:hypothetical protein